MQNVSAVSQMPHDDEYEYGYDKRNDFYCYPGTDVLINKFNIRNLEALSTAERQITALKIARLEETPVSGNFDLNHFRTQKYPSSVAFFATGRESTSYESSSNNI
jgi:hypothetical protein